MTKARRIQEELEGAGYEGFRVVQSLTFSDCRGCGAREVYGAVRVQKGRINRVACGLDCARGILEGN